MKKLVIVVNGESQLEYDRSKKLPEKQRRYLDKMDQQMDTGITHGQGNIFSPQLKQKAEFVANQLIHAIQSDNEQLIAATLSYLAIRLPDLQQVSAEINDSEVKINLIYDREFIQPQPVNFIKPDRLDS